MLNIQSTTYRDSKWSMTKQVELCAKPGFIAGSESNHLPATKAPQP